MPTDEKNEMIVEKAARLTVLMQLQEMGLLDGMSYQKIADLLAEDGEPVHRATIMRDLREIRRVRSKSKSILRRMFNR